MSTQLPADEDDLLRRAYAAWYRAGGMDIPSSFSGVEAAGGKWYVVLRSGTRLMRVYRVRNDGKLKALRRPPAELRDE